MSPKRVTLGRLWTLLVAWWQDGRPLIERLTPGPWRLEATVADMDDVPLSIRPRRAYLVATPTRRKWLVFDCPCGRGHRIALNLDRARRPVWTVRLSKRGSITLQPSVNYRHDRGVCHYVMSNGRIGWVGQSGAPATNEASHV